MNLAKLLAHFVRDATHKLDAILGMAKLNHHLLEGIMSAIEELNAEIAQVKTDVGLAVTKLADLAAQLAALKDGATPDQIAAATAALKEAVAPLENIVTPAPAPEPAPAG